MLTERIETLIPKPVEQSVTVTREEPNGQPDPASKIPALAGTLPEAPEACCKLKRVTSAYDLAGVDDELRRRYEDGDATLHELAAYVNDRITTVTLEAIGNPRGTEPATVRAALQGEESIPATRRDDLRAAIAGKVDVEVLTGSFVSHETIRRHLNEHLDVSTSRGGFSTFEELQEALESYQEQYEDGIESALQRGGRKGLIDGDTYRVFSTRVECERCSESYRLSELLDSGGCDCTDNL